jgi:hypothetical protein
MSSNSTVIRPWVGCPYGASVNGKRVLLLGESNYHKAGVPDANYASIVCENVTECAINGRVRFFTKAAKLVLMASGAQRVARADIVDLWQRVVFTNYVQRVFTSDRIRPSGDDWALARPALVDVLREHKPEVVVVFGLELASHLGWLRDAEPGMAVAAVAHPSSFGFRYERWVPVVAAAFAANSAPVSESPVGPSGG